MVILNHLIYWNRKDVIIEKSITIHSIMTHLFGMGAFFHVRTNRMNRYTSTGF